MNEFILSIIAKLNKQLTRKSISEDLKNLDNSMYINVIAKLSKALTKKAIKQQLKELDNLEVQVGTNVKINKKNKSQIQKNIKELQRNLSDLEIGLKVSNTSTIHSDIESEKKKAQRKAKINPITINLELKKQKLINDIEYLGKRYSKLFSNVSASKKYEDILNSAFSIQNSQQLANTRTQLQAFTSELKANGLATKSVGDRWRQLAERGKDLFSAVSFLRVITAQVKEAISTTIELDSTYTDLIKVQSDLTRNDYSQYLDRCNQKAKELAATQKGLIEGATEFSKSGYDLATSEQLSEKSTILSNVGEMSDADSAKAIISGVQAYDTIDGYSDVVEKAGALIDKYNAIGNTASITTSEIAQGVQSVGSVFADANTSVDEFISLLSAGNRQYQDVDSLALGLRTSALRIRGCTAELKEMGEETDDVVTSTSNLEAKIKALTNVDGSGGVEILEADGKTFKSIYEIYQGIGKVYDQMSDTDQSALLELIAGKNRASAVSATLNNMAEAEEILNNSLNAAGSAQEEYNAYLQSADAHIAKFKASLVETYSTFMNGDMISHTADIGSAVLELINKTDLLKHSILAVLALGIGKGITTFGAAIASTAKQMNTLGSSLLQVKNLSMDTVLKAKPLIEIGEATKNLTEKNLKLLLSQKQLSDQDRIAILRKHNLTEEEAQAKLEKMGLTNATTAQSAANTAETATTFTLSGAMATLKSNVAGLWAVVKANPIGFAFMGITTVVSVATSAISKHNQEVEEAREATLRLSESITEEEENILSLIQQYNQLDKTDRSTENTERIKELNDQINDALGTQASNIDLVNGKLDEQGKKLQENLLKKLQDDQGDLKASTSVAKSEYDAGLDMGTWGLDPWGSVSRALTRNGATQLDGSIFYNIGDVLGDLGAGDQIKQLKSWIDLLSEADGQTGKYGDELASLQKWYSDLNKKQDTYNDALEQQKKNEAEQKILQDSLGGKISSEADYSKYIEALETTYAKNDSLKSQLLEFIGTIYPNYATAVNNAANANEKFNNTSKAGSNTKSFAKAWKDLDNITDDKSSLKDLKADLLELAESGKLTVKAFENTTGSDSFLELTGLSAEETTEKINKLIEDVKQLNVMRTGITAITSAYDEKKDSKKNTVSSSTLDSMYDTLEIEEWDQATQEAWKNYKRNASDGSKSMKDLRKSQNKLATAYVNSNNFLSNLDKTNQDYYDDLLTEMGITNAHEITTNILNNSISNTIQKKLEAKSASIDFSNATKSEIDDLVAYGGQLGLTENQISSFILKQSLANNNPLSTSFSIENLVLLGKQLTLTGKQMTWYTKLMQAVNTVNAAKHTYVDNDTLKKAENNVKKFTKKIQNYQNVDLDIQTTTGNKTNDSSSDKNKTKKSSKTKSTQVIDWISRRLDILQSKIDVAKTKFENLFSLGAKKTNINTQLAQTQKLLTANEKAATKYQKKANSIVISKNAKENEKLKKKVRNGQIAGSLSSLIATYGEAKAEKIQKYQDYIDKAKEAKQATDELRASIKDLNQQKLELTLENNESKRSYSKAKYANATNVSAKNKILDEEIASYHADDKAYQTYYNDVVKIRKASGKKATTSVTKSKLSSSVKNKIKSLIKKGKEIPSNLLVKVKKSNTSLYNKLVNYNNDVDFVTTVLNEKKTANEENKTSRREKQIEKYQNYADYAEKNYNKYKAYEENDTTAATKNKNEGASRKSLKEQYEYLIKIAHAEGDITEEKRLQAELQTEIAESVLAEMENISADYDRFIAEIERKQSALESQIAVFESNGGFATSAFYNDLSRVEKAKLPQLEREKKKLQQELSDSIENGEIKTGTDAWYDAIERIYNVEEAIRSANESYANYLKTARDAEYQLAEYRRNAISTIQTENDLYQSLLDGKDKFDDNGALNEYGKASLALAVSDIGSSIQLVEEYQDSLENLEKKYKDGEIKYAEYIEKQEEYTEGMQDAATAIYAQRDAIKSLIEESYDAQLDALNELIDKYVDALDAEKSLRDYQNSIEEKTSSISSIKKQIEALTGNTTEEARAKLQKLTVELNEAQKDLEDTQYDKYIDDQKEILDDLSSVFEEFMEQQLEGIDDRLDSIIEKLSFGEDIATTLNEFTSKYGFTISDDLAASLPGSEAGKEMSKYVASDTEKNLTDDTKNIIFANTETTNGQIKDISSSNADDMQAITLENLLASLTSQYAASGKGDKLTTAKDDVTAIIKKNKTTGYPTNLVDGYIYSKVGYRISDTGHKELAKYLGVSDYMDRQKVLTKLKNAGFSSGGIIGRSDINSVLRHNGDNVLIGAKVGESVLTAAQTKELRLLMNNLVPIKNIMDTIPKMPNYKPPRQVDTTVNVGDINVHLDGTKVNDAESMYHTIQHSKKLRILVENVIAGSMTDNNKLSYMKP